MDPKGPAASTRRARKKQRTRREIFEAAMALSERRGFDGVTVEQICREADVARATFFLHFPGKAALLSELDRRLAAELAERLVEPRGTAVAELRELVEWLGGRWPRHAHAMGAMLREQLATPGAVAAAPPASRALRDVVEGIVRRGQRRGELRRGTSPRLAAAMILAAVAAIFSGAPYEDDDVTPERARSQLLQAVLHGLLPSRPRLKWSPSLVRGGS